MIKANKPFLIIFALLNLLAGEAQAAEHQCEPEERIFYDSIGNSQKRLAVIGNYEIKATKHNTFTIKKSGKLIYSDCDLNHEVIEESKGTDEQITSWAIHFKNDNNGLPIIGKDITGNGISKLVIYYSYHANYCCGSAIIFELGKKFKKIAKIKGGSGDFVFTNIDDDKFSEIFFSDNYYFGWHMGETSNDYPYPKIVLKWNGVEYVLRPDLMRKKPPEMDELVNDAKRISTDERWGNEYSADYIPLKLIQKSLDLMYSGNEELGWKFARMAWSTKFPVDETFFTEWRNKMAQNPVWQAIINNRNISASDIKTALDREAETNKHK